MHINRSCFVTILLSAGCFGAFVAYAMAAAKPGDEMTLGTVIDVFVVANMWAATALVLWKVSQVCRELRDNRWEIKLARQEMRTTRGELLERMPTSKAIAGYAIAALVSDDEGAEVIELRG